MCTKYKDLILSYVNRKISAEQFESAYLELFKHDTDQVLGVQFNILENLFFAIDDFVADPELRAAVHGLNEEDLRKHALEAYQQLYLN
ncbi:MAG: colicin immunity domain-containing protein [Mycobacterium sp.]|uniref:colicin immunity domain-containing protein n=1 Tax=Mycobacterium sp. TaxID=1785 RepID=UPI003CC61CED